MADKKISALTGATTPLAGTEVLPIVQSGSTVKVAVSDLTAGRSVSASSLSLTTTPLGVASGGLGASTLASGYLVKGNAAAAVSASVVYDNGTNVGIGTITPSAKLTIYNSGSGDAAARIGNAQNTNTTDVGKQGSTGYGATSAGDGFLYSVSNLSIMSDGGIIKFSAGGNTEHLRVGTTGDITASTGNLVVGTAGKGIDFSANASAPGMTSEVLTWYETGTWTPNQGSGLTVVGVFSSTGRYTRVGNQVTITGTLSGSGSIALSGPGIIFTNIPYAVAGPACGSMNSSSLNSSGAITAISGTTVYGNTSPAVSTIYFAMTYLV